MHKTEGYFMIHCHCYLKKYKKGDMKIYLMFILRRQFAEGAQNTELFQSLLLYSLRYSNDKLNTHTKEVEIFFFKASDEFLTLQ